MYPIIMIYGNAGSGKDYIAAKIESDPGFPYVAKIALADPIKELLVRVVDWPEHSDLFGPSSERSNVRFWKSDKATRTKTLMEREAPIVVNKYIEQLEIGRNRTQKHIDDLLAICSKIIYRKAGTSARMALQEVGDWGRAIHPELWIRLTLQRAEELLSNSLIRTDTVIITDGRYKNEVLAIKKIGGAVIKVNPLNKDFVPDKHSSEQDQVNIPDFWFDTVLNNSNDMPALHRFLNKYQCRPSINLFLPPT
jgi:hypothetical protein